MCNYNPLTNNINNLDQTDGRLTFDVQWNIEILTLVGKREVRHHFIISNGSRQWVWGRCTLQAQYERQGGEGELLSRRGGGTLHERATV